MTEVPEHLLQRSRDRRSALGLGGGDSPIAAAAAPKAAAAVEAVSDAGAAPAKAAAPAPVAAAPAAPVPPYVQAAVARRKIPVWAMPVLLALPIWALIYALTLDKPTAAQPGARAVGLATYGGLGCSGCHGGDGGGGVGPQLNGGSVVAQFPNAADHLYWVMLGSQGFKDKGLLVYGTKKTSVNAGNMPGWATTLTASQLIGVVRHEREVFGGEKFDPKEYDQIQAMIDKNFPARSAEFKTAITYFKTLPADA